MTHFFFHLYNTFILFSGKCSCICTILKLVILLVLEEQCGVKDITQFFVNIHESLGSDISTELRKK